MVSCGDELVGAGLRRQLALHGRQLGAPRGGCVLSRMRLGGNQAWCAEQLGSAGKLCGRPTAAGCGVEMQVSRGVERAGSLRQRAGRCTAAVEEASSMLVGGGVKCAGSTVEVRF